MRERIRILAGSIASLAFGVLACTPTYTDADLVQAELDENAAARAEALEEEEIMEEGGVNNRSIDGAAEDVERLRDL
jgi:hypothetical protein